MAMFRVELLVSVNGNYKGEDVPGSERKKLEEAVRAAVERRLITPPAIPVSDADGSLLLDSVEPFSFIEHTPIETNLPDWLWGTATHINCPAVYLVNVGPPTSDDIVWPAASRPPEDTVMAFRGMRRDTQAVAISRPTQFGHTEPMYFVPRARVSKLDPRETDRRIFFNTSEDDVEPCLTIVVANGVVQNIENLPHGWIYEVVDAEPSEET